MNTAPNPIDYTRLPALGDNYIWIIHNPSSGAVAVVDPGDAGVVLDFLNERGLKPSKIVNTHHHHDHTAGNAELLERFDIPLIAPSAESHRIKGITHGVQGGDVVEIAGYRAEVIATPGHTLGHVAFFLANCFADSGVGGLALVGDTLFSMGCGRVFEGTMADMWGSLCRLRGLPDNTWIAAGHEYSAANARYVESLNWGRAEALERCHEIHALRAKGEATLPVLLGTEKKANPFLNCDKADLAKALDLDHTNPVAVFTALRRGKDNF